MKTIALLATLAFAAAAHADTLTVRTIDGKTLDRAAWRSFIAAITPGIRRVETHRHKIVALSAEGTGWKTRVDEQEAYDIVDTAAMFGKKNDRHHLSIESSYEEVCIQTPKGWKVRSVTMLSEKRTLDHKPLSTSE